MTAYRTTVAVEPPVYVLARSLPPSRYARGGSKARIVSLFAWGVSPALFVALVTGLVIGPRARHGCFGGGSRVDIASLTIKKYAFEAYPSFREANPQRTCPVALRELDEWMNREGSNDPWGTPFTMTCTGGSILVGSAGEDATFGTADDLWSNE